MEVCSQWVPDMNPRLPSFWNHLEQLVNFQGMDPLCLPVLIDLALTQVPRARGGQLPPKETVAALEGFFKALSLTQGERDLYFKSMNPLVIFEDVALREHFVAGRGGLSMVDLLLDLEKTPTHLGREAVRQLISHGTFGFGDGVDPWGDLENVLSQLSMGVEHMQPRPTAFVAHLFQALFQEAFVFTEGGHHYFLRKIKTLMVEGNLTSELTSHGGGVERNFYRALLKDFSQKKNAFTLGHLKRRVFQWTLNAFPGFSQRDLERLWGEEACATHRSTLWRSLNLREGDIWVRTSENGVGDLFSSLAGVPKLATHGGLIGAHVEEGVQVYYIVEINHGISRAPLSFRSEIILRPTFPVENGFVERSLKEITDRGPVQFNLLFDPTLGPQENGTTYLYCTQLIHLVFALAGGPSALSPFEGAPSRIHWNRGYLEHNAQALGFSTDGPHFVPSYLLFSPSTHFVGAVLLREHGDHPPKKALELDLKRALDDFVVYLMERYPLKTSQGSLKSVAASLVPPLLGTLHKGFWGFLPLPPSWEMSLTQLKNLNPNNPSIPLLLSFVSTYMRCLNDLKVLAKESVGRPDEAFDRLEATLFKKMAQLFEGA